MNKIKLVNIVYDLKSFNIELLIQPIKESLKNQVVGYDTFGDWPITINDVLSNISKYKPYILEKARDIIKEYTKLNENICNYYKEIYKNEKNNKK